VSSVSSSNMRLACPAIRQFECTPCADAKLDIEKGRSLHKPQTTDSVLVLSFISPKSFHLRPFPNASPIIAAKQFQIPHERNSRKFRMRNPSKI
jgi:hypothetical protein